MGRLVRMGAVAAVFATCGGEEVNPFCREVLPAVEDFMARARSDHPTPDDPRYGGTVVVGGSTELAGGMNPATSGDYFAVQHQQFAHLMTLINYDEALRPRPYLAESWELSADGRALTFHLRRDVLWHDGEPTTARDVAFTYEVVTDPATGFPNDQFWDFYVRGADGVEILDDFTVRIGLEPHSDHLDPFRYLPILPEHLLGDVPHDSLGQHPFGTQCPVGNGPFVFSEHRIQDRWVFDANPAFPAALGGRPFLDRYVYRVVPEPTTLLAELLTGSVDVYVRVSPDQARAIIDDPDLRLVAFPWRGYTMVIWNERRPPLADPRVRRALTMGTDRQEVVDAILRGYGRVAHSSIPPWHYAHDSEATAALPYDPAHARALLDSAGWRDRDGDGIRESADGAPLALSVKYNSGAQVRRSIAEIMQAQLAEIGVAAQPQAVEWLTLLGQLYDPTSRDFDGVVMGLAPEFKLDDSGLFHSRRIDDPLAWSGVRNPVMDSLMDRLNEPLGRADALRTWREYERALIEEQPFTFFFYEDRLAGMSTRLRDAVMDPRGELQNVEEWYIDPGSR